MNQTRASSVQSETRNRRYNRDASRDRRPSNARLNISNIPSSANNAVILGTSIDRPATTVGFISEESEKTRLEEVPESPSFHRALAYDALTRNSRTLVGSNQGHKHTDPRPSQTYPPIYRPASAAPTFREEPRRRSRAESREAYESSLMWHPQMLAYALPLRNPEIGSSRNTSLPQSDRYRAQSTPPEQRGRPKTRHGPIAQSGNQPSVPSASFYEAQTRQSNKESDIHGDFTSNTYPLTLQNLDRAARNDVRVSQITEQGVVRSRQSTHRGDRNREVLQEAPIRRTSTHTSLSTDRSFSQSSTISRGRRTTRTRPSSPAPYSHASYSSSVASSSRLSREVSPSRGAWRSDNPQQERPSFRERARQRFSQNLHLNLRRAGLEAQSSFTVHSVVKTTREYVPALAAAATPSAPSSPLDSPDTPTPTASWGPPNTAKPFAMQWRNSKLGLSDDEEEPVTIEKKDYMNDVKNVNRTFRPEDFEGLEERARKHQRQWSFDKVPKGPDATAATGEPTNASSERERERERDSNSDSDKSLFLDGGGRKTRSSTTSHADSFFATEWARLRAQEALTPVRLLNPFGPDAVDTQADAPSRTSSGRGSVAAASDDRGSLPSQSRQGSLDDSLSLVIAVGLTESPEVIEPAMPVPGVGTGTGVAQSQRPVLRRKQGSPALR